MSLRIVNDLPPRWDDRAVVWQGWAAPIVSLCAKVPEDACTACGMRRSPSINQGLIADDTEMTRAEVAKHDRIMRLGRLPKRIQRRAWISLTAFRCPDCGHDTVWDGESMWDLEPCDYEDDGSFNENPTLF